MGGLPPALPPRARLPLLFLGFLSLLAGIAGGLARLGFEPMPVSDDGVLLHGALLASGFFGTLIALERAAALDRLWGYASPLACGLGGLALAGGAPRTGSVLLLAGAVLLVAMSAVFVRRQSSLESWTLAGAAVCWSAGNGVLAAGAAVPAAVPWWIAFFALTIGAERLELSRYMPKSGAAHAAFLAIAIALAAGAPISLALQGAVLGALAAWLFAFDIARKTIRGIGLPRYIAACLLGGYAWLAIGGVLLAALGAQRAGPLYDAALHAFFVGFVFCMVFGHAPVILPAVLRVALGYTPRFYFALGLLHLSLALRVAGDLAGVHGLRAAGSIGNAAAIATFIALAAWSVLARRR
ncbi:MAG: hypothetical protein IT513_04810 [Burkholderiales bacterium]|nr:hypothetical protein [Burkholderiales bacterium]